MKFIKDIITLLFVLAILAIGVSAQQYMYNVPQYEMQDPYGSSYPAQGSNAQPTPQQFIPSAQVNYNPWNVRTCAISTGHGLLQDFDCDQIPDFADNCYDIPNTDQKDSNNDGIGDTCAQLLGLPVEKEEKSPIFKNQESKPKTKSDVQANVKVTEIQDVNVGGPGAVYPIKLTNDGRTDERFIIEITDMDFGTYRIDPSSTLIVKAGETETAYLHVLASDDAESGQYNFNMKVTAGSESQETTLTANILADKKEKKGLGFKKSKTEIGVVLGWIVVIIVLIILGVILAQEFERRGKPRSKQPRDADIYSYY